MTLKAKFTLEASNWEPKASITVKLPAVVYRLITEFFMLIIFYESCFPTFSGLDSRLEAKVHRMDQRFDSKVIQIDAVINFE